MLFERGDLIERHISCLSQLSHLLVLLAELPLDLRADPDTMELIVNGERVTLPAGDVRLGLSRLEDSVEQLAEKGASESLVILDDHAFIVGVPKRKVITALSRTEAMGNVFTKLDSVLFAA